MKSAERRASALFGEFASVLRSVSQEIAPKSVHRLRTTSRRLESALAFFRPSLTQKQRNALQQLEALRRRAGKVRDCDIQLGLLEEIANRSTRSDRDTVAKALHTRRTKQAKRLSGQVEEFMESKSPARMRKVSATLSALLSGMPPAQPLTDASLALDLLRQSVRDESLRDPNELHALRLRFKKIRYLAELAAPSAEQKAFVEALKQVQDAIGQWHDWQMLEEIAQKQLKEKDNCSLLVEIRALCSSHHEAAVAATRRLLHPPAAGRKEVASAPAHPVKRTQAAG